MRTAIISAFPGCGKSYFYNKYNGEICAGRTPWKILDSDSSEFSWIKDENGCNTKERNPNFPNNYIQHIKDNIGKVDIIFVSSHKEVRKALKDNEINFFLFFPEKSLKEDFIQRYIKRGNNESFVNFIYDNWDNFIDEMEGENDKFCLIDHLTKDCPYINLHMVDLCLDTSMGNLFDPNGRNEKTAEEADQYIPRILEELSKVGDLYDTISIPEDKEGYDAIVREILSKRDS